MSNFIANEVEGSLEDLDSAVIFCPLCKQKCVMDQGKTCGLVSTPKGLFLIHNTCVDAWNERAALLRDLGV